MRHFSVVGDHVRRIPPVAASPRDFADEWIVSSWKEASGWSAPKQVQILRQVHARVSRLESAGGYYFEYDSIRECSDTAEHYQIAIVAIRGEKNLLFYFQVSGNPEYRMDDVSQEPNPACTGPDLLQTMQTQ
jgi:hypothetical protein